MACPKGYWRPRLLGLSRGCLILGETIRSSRGEGAILTELELYQFLRTIFLTPSRERPIVGSFWENSFLT